MSFDAKIQELMADFQRQRESLAETQRRMREISGVAVAPRQAVKVAVNSNGELTEITFPTGAYKNMAPKELADVLLAVVGEARANAMKSVMELVGGQLKGSDSIAEMLGGEADLTKGLSVDSLMAPEVREYLGPDAPFHEQTAKEDQ
ncbi:YbaB/EbfC family nucleoid-associated protein [Lentzea sp. NPDC058436]|uniref:YbaB/EbfC family nucleoid-associated protein n=1 Tax=Lentzea sp. NPDC058436 TaxID=3346499 RepID=UPI00364FD170